MRGVWTALVSPMTSKGQLDLGAYRALLQEQKAAQVAGVIPCGTTGESPALSWDEKKTLIETALKELQGSQTQVVAGTGSNNTAETIEMSKWASDQGVAGVLLVTPYYNKPSQTGLEGHFRAVADAVKCEVMLYNVPGRTGVSLEASTVAQLAKHPKISSLKEATGNVAFTSEILHALALQKQKLDLLSGDDATYLPLLSVGATGIVSVASNLIPKVMVSIQNHAEKNQWAEARALHQQYYPIFRDLFVESNPVPIKYALNYTGKCTPYVRMPLAAMATANIQKLEKSLSLCGISKGESRA